jgi:hypothetical protein
VQVRRWLTDIAATAAALAVVLAAGGCATDSRGARSPEAEPRYTIDGFDTCEAIDGRALDGLVQQDEAGRTQRGDDYSTCIFNSQTAAGEDVTLAVHVTAHATILEGSEKYADDRLHPYGLVAKVGQPRDIAGVGDEAAHRSGNARKGGYTYVEHLFVARQDNLTVNIQLRVSGLSSNPGGEPLSTLTNLAKRMIEKSPRA